MGLSQRCLLHQGRLKTQYNSSNQLLIRKEREEGVPQGHLISNLHLDKSNSETQKGTNLKTSIE
jgi:retron-type reverse transcriptase